MGVKISLLPGATTPLSGGELIPMTQAGVTVEATVQKIVDLALAQESGGTGTGPDTDRLSNLLDVLITSPTDGEVLTYDSGLGMWVNAPAGGGGVGTSTTGDTLSIGDRVWGSAINRVLYSDGSAQLAGSASFTYDVTNGLIVSGYMGSGPAGTFTDTVRTVYLADGSYAVNVSVGHINSPGTNGNTYRWNTGASVPSPTAGGLSITPSHYGSSDDPFMGAPDAWVLINIGGTDYKIPAYL